MTRPGVWPGCFVDRHSVMNVVPILRCCVGRIDVERLDDIDHLQHPFDLRPTGKSQQALTARRDLGHGGIALSRRRCAQDIDAGQHRPKVVGRPTHKREDAARGE